MDTSRSLGAMKPLNLVDKYKSIVLVYGVGQDGGEMGKIEVPEGTLVVQIDFNSHALSQLEPSSRGTANAATLRRVGADDPNALDQLNGKASTILALNFLDEPGSPQDPVHKDNEENFENIVREWHRLLKPGGKVFISAWFTPEDVSYARTDDCLEEGFTKDVVQDWDTVRSYLEKVGYRDGALAEIEADWKLLLQIVQETGNSNRISRKPFLTVLTKI